MSKRIDRLNNVVAASLPADKWTRRWIDADPKKLAVRNEVPDPLGPIVAKLRPRVLWGDWRTASYFWLEDVIKLPDAYRFITPADLVRTLSHELGHWTGHPDRMGRASISLTAFNYIASLYEEIVAESFGFLLSDALGVADPVQSAAYIGSRFETSPGVSIPTDLRNEAVKEAIAAFERYALPLLPDDLSVNGSPKMTSQLAPPPSSMKPSSLRQEVPGPQPLTPTRIGKSTFYGSTPPPHLPKLGAQVILGGSMQSWPAQGPSDAKASPGPGREGAGVSQPPLTPELLDKMTFGTPGQWLEAARDLERLAAKPENQSRKENLLRDARMFRQMAKLQEPMPSAPEPAS